MKRSPVVIIMLCIVILAAGCTTPATNTTENLRYPSGDDIYIPPFIAGNNPTPSPGTEFPFPPKALPEKYWSDIPLGAFEDSFIGTYDCTNASETYGTNYTFFSNSGGTRHIHYQLIPVENMDTFSEVPLPSDILNASITPDDFVALPDYIYQSQVRITVGPNVTGEYHTNPDGSGWGRDPYFPFVLNVTVDGVDASGADDQLTVTKVCSFHSQTRNMQPMPEFYQTPQSDIILKPGEIQSVNITVRNFGGGIRELYVNVPALLNGTGFTFPLEADPGQLRPIPAGMTFNFNPPIMTGNNFRFSNGTLVIGSEAGTPKGNYTFPLVLCYRDLDTDNATSPYFPFDVNSYCDTATQFTVDIV
jgi:hypothetical protein